MTNDFYRNRIGTYKTDPTTFGGVIYNYDFDGYNSLSDIASRIVSDWKFDKRMKSNISQRIKNAKYKKEMREN